MVREFLGNLLARNGYETVAAADGKEGVALFRSEQIDLVITDIIMPEKDGIEAIMDMRRERPRLPLIAISGGGRAAPENYLDAAELLGAMVTIKKPFSNEEILAAVQRLLPH